VARALGGRNGRRRRNCFNGGGSVSGGGWRRGGADDGGLYGWGSGVPGTHCKSQHGCKDRQTRARTEHAYLATHTHVCSLVPNINTLRFCIPHCYCSRAAMELERTLFVQARKKTSGLRTRPCDTLGSVYFILLLCYHTQQLFGAAVVLCDGQRTSTRG